MAGHTGRHLLNAAAHAALIERLTYLGGSINELIEASGMHNNTVRKLISVMHKREPKLVYIFDWNRDSRGRWVIARYRFGDKPDMPRPRPRTSAERWAQEYAQRQNTEMRA